LFPHLLRNRCPLRRDDGPHNKPKRSKAMRKYFKRDLGRASLLALPLALPVFLSGCGAGGSADGTTTDNGDNTETAAMTAADIELATLIANLGLDTDPRTGRNLPSIDSPLAQLGRDLFFSKSLGGDFDSACVSCHHPALGGADGLSLSVGVGAIDPDHLGPGRENDSGIPVVPRNAPTVFNAGLWDSGLFWDSRVESLGDETRANGSQSAIRTPDSAFGRADNNAGGNLPAAQARFPVAVAEEMQGNSFEAGSDNDAVRSHLAARIGGYGAGAGELAQNGWLAQFQQAFGSSEASQTLVTFDNIASAIGEYERSMVFVGNPWRRYLDGDTSALTADQKQGALLFFRPRNQGGAGCVACHSGPLFSDERHHAMAFPHFGPGKGDGATGDDDFGRERETGNANDRYRLRTPSLLNVTATAPYGHAGAYQTLEEVVRHYNNPGNAVARFFDRGGWCQLDQYQTVANCANLYPNARSNSELAIAKLDSDIAQNTTPFRPAGLNATEVAQVVAFLEALTDPCVEDRECLSDWIADTRSNGPDGQQLNAVDQNGGLL
jgi:cytochrome c peroxidase